MGELAVLSYHGWEIDPDRLAGDVASLRGSGWRDCSLAGVEAIVRGDHQREGNYFHVTLDDGAAEDAACVDALTRVSCPATLFISLDAMTEAARAGYRMILSRADAAGIAIGDHSLRHNRVFNSRHVVGFHSDAAPLMTSPERLGLQAGDPVCTYGGELARPRFVPDARAKERCQAAARDSSQVPGSAEWTERLAAALLSDDLAFTRIGRLCLRGDYESREAFRRRIGPYLLEGRDRLAAFTGRAPVAFAHPWWEPSPTADRALISLGYRLTFSGHGLWDGEGECAVPRLFVSNDTPRPLVPERAGSIARARASWAAVREIGRRALWA
jgi:hypothetical protein